MDHRDWTYTQALEYLHTPSSVMRWLYVIRQTRADVVVDVAPDIAPED